MVLLHDISHFGYLEEVLGVRAANDPVYFEQCLKVMTSYASNHDEWWLIADPVERTKHQLDEKILLIPYDVMKLAFIKVLGRSVEDEDISFSNKKLIREFKDRVKTYKPSSPATIVC